MSYGKKPKNRNPWSTIAGFYKNIRVTVENQNILVPFKGSQGLHSNKCKENHIWPSLSGKSE